MYLIRQQNRRDFLKFLGRSTGVASLLLLPQWLLSACTNIAKKSIGYPFEPLAPNSKDSVSLVEGLQFKTLIKHGDKINLSDEKFGYDNDYLAFLPGATKDQGLLWVNHENVETVFIHGVPKDQKRSKEQMEMERKEVGGSILAVEKVNSEWRVKKSSPYNRRLTSYTEIPFDWDESIAGSKTAIGTFGNCAGGVTPWGTVLTCEENYQNFVGEVRFIKGKRAIDDSDNKLRWNLYWDLPPEHYGWVVEVNPKTGESKKLVSLGRFAHEGATLRISKNKKLVLYSGDDKADECIYKFISDSPTSLKKGTLYVADTTNGKWLPLDIDKNKLLKEKFKTQTELLIRTREAAKLAGGTPQDRPEGIDINPTNGDVIVALTYNAKKENHFGSLLKIVEKNGDAEALEFKATQFLAGGPDTGFACPDNVLFDRKGNLWFTTDVADADQNKGIYKPFGNNSLFYVPLSGEAAGIPLRIASGPIESELAGPCFDADGRTLFLSVQHPGGNTQNVNNATSHWPEGGLSTPKPAVIAIKGPLLDKLLS